MICPSVSLFAVIPTTNGKDQFMQTLDSWLIKNRAKMVVVRCLILCSKFTKNRLSAGLCSDPMHGGAYSATPGTVAGSWGEVGRRNGRTGGESKWKGRERGRKGYPQMQILGTALRVRLVRTSQQPTGERKTTPVNHDITCLMTRPTELSFRLTKAGSCWPSCIISFQIWQDGGV